MSEIDLPSISDSLLSEMELDSERISSHQHVYGKVFCCLCGRRLQRAKFSVEHIVPQQFLSNDKKEIREIYSKNERTPLIMLCEERLVIKGKSYRGCNGFKGSIYDSYISKFLAYGDGGRYVSEKYTQNAKNGNRFIQRELIGMMLIMFFALYKEFGYRVVFSDDGRLLRRQFFNPKDFLPEIPSSFWVPMIVDCDNFNRIVVKESLSDPFNIIDPSSFAGSIVEMDGKIVERLRNFSYHLVTFRNIAMGVPIRSPLPSYFSKNLIVPERYRLKPNFDTVIE